MTTYDYVIVGAGSAGAVLANRLSADPEVRVALLEAGGPGRNPWLHVPVGYFKTMHNPASDWCYVTEPDPGLNGRRLKWPRGKVLGGSSAINGLLYIRGHPRDYDEWRQLGNVGWAFEDVLPYFKRAEDQERGADDYHGTGGPLRVGGQRLHRPIGESVIRGAEEIGVPRNDDFNGPEQEGVGYFQLTMLNGLRCSTATGYLRPVRRRPNLDVVTRAHVEGVRFDGTRATGVAYRRSGAARIANARREVILSAGAIGSPQLLQLSGIGPGEMLQRHGVPVMRAAPQVGRNLQDHLQIRAVFKTRNCRTLNDEVHNPLRRVLMGLEYALWRTGPLTLAASQVCAFVRSRPGLERPDIQYHVQPLSADVPGEGLDRFSAITLSTCQLRPESRGAIEITSPRAGDHPAIRPNYLSTDLDAETAVAGVRLSRRIAATAALSPYVASEYKPGAAAQSDADLLEFCRNEGTTIYHPVGTCRMGPDEEAVVDPRLRVRGVAGLRVVDASVMPRLVSGNTNAPTIMIAEKAADMIREDAHAGAGPS